VKRRLESRVWPNTDSGLVFPECQDGRPSTGVCFSGGGTRSYAATIGQLRGLAEIGLLERIGYVSAVSGGAWAATAHAYYAGPGQTNGEILGAVSRPEELDAAALSRLSESELGIAATRDFRQTLMSLHQSPAVAADRIWVQAVGETFLSPFGLFEAERPQAFTLDSVSSEEIRIRNPAIGPLHEVRKGREAPYLITHATLNWPSDSDSAARKVGFEYSPLYCGSPVLYRLESKGQSVSVGGGLVESCAFGCDPPLVPFDADDRITVEQEQPFTLADAIGASSAFRTADRDNRFYPHVQCWPVTKAAAPGRRYLFSDGGDLENFGIISLLRRKVRSIVVFVNTVWPLSLRINPDAGWPVDPTPETRVMDPFMAPLFGAPNLAFPNNKVFSEGDFSLLHRRLQEAKHSRSVVAATMTHQVQENTWWGVAGGWDVRVCWVYNECVPEWEERLPLETRRCIQGSLSAEKLGFLGNFPHYRTQGQNPGALIRLTPSQVNLLSHLSCWTVTRQADKLNDLLGSP
jgi:hypothetical protein